MQLRRTVALVFLVGERVLGVDGGVVQGSAFMASILVSQHYKPGDYVQPGGWQGMWQGSK